MAVTTNHTDRPASLTTMVTRPSKTGLGWCCLRSYLLMNSFSMFVSGLDPVFTWGNPLLALIFICPDRAEVYLFVILWSSLSMIIFLRNMLHLKMHIGYSGPQQCHDRNLKSFCINASSQTLYPILWQAVCPRFVVQPSEHTGFQERSSDL